MYETQVQSLGQENHLEKEMATHSSNSFLGNHPWGHKRVRHDSDWTREDSVYVLNDLSKAQMSWRNWKALDRVRKACVWQRDNQVKRDRSWKCHGSACIQRTDPTGAEVWGRSQDGAQVSRVSSWLDDIIMQQMKSEIYSANVIPRC